MKKNNNDSDTPRVEPVTYAAILAEMERPLWGDVPRDRPVPTMVRNLRTQMNAWLAFVMKALDDEIGHEFGGQFNEQLQAFGVAQAGQGRKASVVRDRTYAISRARAAYLRFATSALPSSFSGALDALIVMSGVSGNEVARRADIPERTLWLWRAAKTTPNARHHRVPELERAVGATPGTLTCRLPRTSLPTNVQVIADAPSTPFRDHMRAMARQPQYSLKYITGELQEEWGKLLRYKSTPLPGLKRHARGVWRAKPAAMCRTLQPVWCHELPSGMRVTSAHVAWTHVAQFLGWLTLPQIAGGMALSPDEVQTLAWLAISELVERFMRWSAERSGAFNAHTLAFLNTTCSLLSPETGYINQCEWMAERLPSPWQPAQQWPAHCELAYRHLNALRLKLSATVQVTRDPESAIRDILARPDPLTPLVDMLRSMEEAMPPLSAPHDRAIMLRDILLVALLIANPLRITQYMTMQSGPGTDENLCRDGAGRWCIRFAPEHVKNSRFRSRRQRARAYNVSLAPWVVPMLERYLEHARPVLLKGHCSPYLLVGQLGRHPDLNTPFSNIDDRLQLLTARFIPGSPGFRAHAFRHIVATAWLKTHPRDYLTVARMLDDKLETVIAVYAHLEIGDSLDDYSAWVSTMLKY